MEHGQLPMVADTCQGVCSEPLLHACGKDVQLCHRQRVRTPLRLGVALTATCASQRGETIADWPCGFQALCGTTVTSNAFSHQVAKPHCADCARTMTARRLSARTLQGLGCTQGQACAACRPIVMQDGRSCALHDGVREVWPGRGKAVQPAALALQTPMAWLCDPPPTVVLTPAPASDHALLPEPTALRARVLWADRGSSDFHDLRRVQDAGGFCLLRAKAGRHPQGLEALRAEGTRWRSRRHTPLQTLHAQLPPRQRGALGVQWHVDGPPLGLRLVISWQRRTKRFCSLRTHLSPQRSPLDTMCRAYPWRWHVA